MILALAGTALLYIAAKIKIPFYPVPMTMQTFVVLVLGMAYGWRLGGATLILYLAEGAVGLPVFAGTPEKGIGLAYMLEPCHPLGGTGQVCAAQVEVRPHSAIWIRGRVSHRQISPIKSGPQPIVTVQGRSSRSDAHCATIGRSHLENPGSKTAQWSKLISKKLRADCRFFASLTSWSGHDGGLQ